MNIKPIIKRMKELDMSSAQLAREAGLTKGTTQYLLNCDHKPDPRFSTVCAIAEVLNLELKDLV